MLARRAQAVRVRDEAAFLATVDRRDPRLVAQQRTLFANLAQVRLARYDYETTADELPTDPVRGAAPQDPVVRFQSVEHAQVADALTGPIGNEVRMTYVRRDGRWLVGRETAPERVVGDGTRLRPWLGGPVDVADHGALVALADAAHAGLAEEVADIVEDAVVADAALLQVAPHRRVLVDATGNSPAVRLNAVDDEEAAAIYTGVSDLDAQGRRTTASGGAIRVNPALTAEEITGDPGLLRHEVVHLLLRRYAGVLPMWLSEGIAEYARWHPLTTADLRVPPALWRRTQEAPRGLPETGVFQLDPAVSYLVSQAAAQHSSSSVAQRRCAVCSRATAPTAPRSAPGCTAVTPPRTSCGRSTAPPSPGSSAGRGGRSTGSPADPGVVSARVGAPVPRRAGRW